MYTQRVAGFTLVELLVVMAIAALMISITLPVYLNMRRTNRYNTCMQNMKEIGTALELYRADFGYYPAPPKPDYLQYMRWQDLPYSTTRQWSVTGQVSPAVLHCGDVLDLQVGMRVIVRPATTWTVISKPSDSSLELNSVANLSSDTPVTLTDNATGSTEQCTITDVDATNRVITLKQVLVNLYQNGGSMTAVLPSENATITSIDANNENVTFVQNVRYDYALGGVIAMAPAHIPAQTLAPARLNQLQLDTIAGLSTGMRVTLYDSKPTATNTPRVLDQPVVVGIDPGTNIVTFQTELQRQVYSGGEYLTWAVGNDGLATLFAMYLNDQRSYLRGNQRFHCPMMVKTEGVDRTAILAQQAINTSTALAAYHNFDPLFAGYNTYDLTYNYDQYDGTIKLFDQAMGYSTGSGNVSRQLRNPTPPADTAVCWCYGHFPGQWPSLGPNGRAVAGDPATVKQQYADFISLVLWVDGSVAPVPATLAPGVDGYNYWVPPCLYTRGDANK